MRVSFDNSESFKEAVESLRFNNLSSDPNARQQMGSSSSMPLEEFDWNLDEDNIIPSDPITLRRVGSSSSILETRTRGGDIQVCLHPPRNPEFTSTNGMCMIQSSKERKKSEDTWRYCFPSKLSWFQSSYYPTWGPGRKIYYLWQVDYLLIV